MIVRPDDLTGDAIGALLRHHLEEAHRNSPPGSVFAFDIERLKAPDVTFWSAWEGDALLGCGALREVAPDHGEVKSMRTAPEHVRKGVGAAILDQLIDAAKARGYRRLSLETGSGAAYESALGLYRRRGFTSGAAFGGYVGSDFNQFFHLEL
ncbi:GNAT family N-acetyltransferase [Sphingosinicellaceae bacterium]|nr:GNAT family N-acetyltransferase [Sphingosinicellaceae bacterium]